MILWALQRLTLIKKKTRIFFAVLLLLLGVLPSENISLQQTLFLSSFPITPRAVTQNYLRSILYHPEQTKAWECFQRQEGEASRVGWDVSWHLLFHSPCRTTKASTQDLIRPFSISDRLPENVLHLVTQARSEAVGPEICLGLLSR